MQMKEDKMKFLFFKRRFCHLAVLAMTTTVSISLLAQNNIDLTTLASFQSASANWHIAGAVRADLNQKNILMFSPGTGILNNQAEQVKHVKDMILHTSHVDPALDVN